MTTVARPVSNARRAAEVLFWVGVAGLAVFGVIAGWGLGPGPIVAAIVLAAYGALRRGRIPTRGYLLLIAGTIAIPAVALAVTWSRQG